MALSLIPGRVTPAERFPTDKILHLFAFAYLGYLCARSFTWWGLLAVLLFGVGNEILQLVTPGRQVAFLDFAANEIGAVAGFFIGYLRRRRALQAG